MVQPGKPQMTDNIILHVCFACWIAKAANTHVEYVMLIALLTHKLLRERSYAPQYYYFILYCLVSGSSKVLCIERELMVASSGIMFMLSSCLFGSMHRVVAITPIMGFVLRCGLSRLLWK